MADNPSRNFSVGNDHSRGRVFLEQGSPTRGLACPETRPLDYLRSGASGRPCDRRYRVQIRLPYRLEDLVTQLKQITRKDDYLHNAVETMRLAQHARSPAEKARPRQACGRLGRPSGEGARRCAATQTAADTPSARRKEIRQASGLTSRTPKANSAATALVDLIGRFST